MRARKPVLLVVVGTLLAGLAAAPPAPAAGKRKALRAFEDCSALARYGNRHLNRYSPGSGGPMPGPPAPMPTEGGGSDGAPVMAPSAPERAEDVSSTNTQEADVYEPDIVKSDGRAVYALVNGALRVVELSGEAPALAATLRLGNGHGHQMLLRDGRLIVMWQEGAGTVLALVDVSDPAKPTVLRTLTTDGALLAARRVGSTVRVVLSSVPEPVYGPAPTDAPVALDAAAGGGKRWLPRGTLRNVRSGRTRTRRLVGCRAVRRPRVFSGLQTLTVLTLDFEKGLEPLDSDAVMSGAETVYASTRGLFVATQRFVRGLEDRTTGPVPEDLGTQIHHFATGTGRETVYRGTGRVPGFLLNQFAMSQSGDVLRVASTDQPPWFAGREGREPESFVTTLRLGEQAMKQIGQVGGLGRGERIFGVRFIGDVGYVVTFRQIDPLYTVDVSDPAAPRVRGELKILGYSAYLHPIAEGLLLGVGQDATETGQRTGALVSLFDVSDLDDPKLLQRAPLGDGSTSDVEYDHHAFLWWPKTGLAVLPVQFHGRAEPVPEPGPGPAPVAAQTPQPFVGAVGLTVSGQGIAELGRITHAADPAHAPAITRSLVVGDRLYTLSPAGLKASSLDTLADIAFVAF